MQMLVMASIEERADRRDLTGSGKRIGAACLGVADPIHEATRRDGLSGSGIKLIHGSSTNFRPNRFA